MLENDAGWKMKVVPELTVSYRFGFRLLTPRPLGTSSLKAIFRSAEGSGCSVSSRTEALWSFIVRATVRLGEERSDNCVPNVPKVRCRRDETSGSVSHLLFHLMYMCVCVCVCFVNVTEYIMLTEFFLDWNSVTCYYSIKANSSEWVLNFCVCSCYFKAEWQKGV